MFDGKPEEENKTPARETLRQAAQVVGRVVERRAAVLHEKSSRNTSSLLVAKPHTWAT